MLESAWSEPQSGVTEELGLAISSGEGGAASPLMLCQHFASDDAAPRQRCVMPKAQPSSLNRRDQRVPVYWDQTVPVWEGGGGAASATKRKASPSHARGLQGRGSRRFEGGGMASSSDHTASLENSEESCACSTGRDGGSWSGNGGARNPSSEVSFDAILSMYASSLVEKYSLRRDGWVLGATVFKPRQDSPRRRTFAGRGLISLQLSPSRALMSAAGVYHDEPEPVRRLRVAFKRTTDCDSPSTTGDPGSVRLRNADPIGLPGCRRSCDFHRRDPLNFTTAMFTATGSSSEVPSKQRNFHSHRFSF